MAFYQCINFFFGGTIFLLPIFWIGYVVFFIGEERVVGREDDFLIVIRVIGG